MAIEGVRSPVQRAARTAAGTRLLGAAETRALAEKIRNAVSLDPKEQALVASLTPEQRAQYAAVAAKLSPEDRDALRGLLERGKLNGGRDLQMRGDLLANLARLATQPMGAGIDRRRVLSDAVRAVSDASSITQGAAETCGAATAQILLARQNPAEYVRILAGLSSTEGQVTLVNGNTISRPANWDKADIPGAANQLMQTAFMDYAAGGYDVATDTRADGQKGLYASEQAYLQEGLLGKASETVHGNGDDVMERIAAEANAGKAVSVLIEAPSDGPRAGNAADGQRVTSGRGHYVQVTAVKDGKVTYVDPRDGKAHTVDAGEFQTLVRATNFEAAPGTRLRKARPTDQKGMLGGCGVFKAIGKAVKSVGKAIGGAVKSVANAVVGAVKTVARATVSVVKSVVNVVVDVAKKVWEGVKEVGKFVAKHLDKILLVAQVVCMFVPGLQVVSLAIAGYNAVKGGIALYQGIKNGDWKQALGGAIGVVASVAGGVGALGAKVVGQGAMAVANVAGKVANVAGNVMNAANAIERGDWGSLVSSVASGVAAGAGIVSESAGKVAERFAGYAHKLNGVYQGVVNENYGAALGSAASLVGTVGKGEFGMADKTAAGFEKAAKVLGSVGGVQQAAKSGNTAALATSALGLVDVGVKTAAGDDLTDQEKKDLGTFDKVINYGKQAIGAIGTVASAIKSHGAGAVLGVLGGAAAIGGIRYLTMTPEERAAAEKALKDAGSDWSKGNFDSAARNGASVLGVDKEGGFGAFLGKLGTFAGNALNLAEAYSRAKNLADVAAKTGYFDLDSANKNLDRARQGFRGLTDLLGITRKEENPGVPAPSTTPGTSRLQHTAGELLAGGRGKGGGGVGGYRPEDPADLGVA